MVLVQTHPAAVVPQKLVQPAGNKKPENAVKNKSIARKREKYLKTGKGREFIKKIIPA